MKIKKCVSSLLIFFMVFSCITVIPIKSVMAEQIIMNDESKDIKKDKPKQEAKVVKEIEEKRTKNTKHYQMSDGTYKAEIYAGDINYIDTEGKYQPIDTSLSDESTIDPNSKSISKESKKSVDKAKKNRALKDDSGYKPLHVNFDASLPKNFIKGYYIGIGEDKLEFIPVGANPSKGLLGKDGSSADYLDAWQSTDVNLKVLENGIKETITLNNSQAPPTFSFEVKGKLADDLTSGQLKLEPAWLEGANGEHRDVEQKIINVENKTYLELKPDVSGLTYPIVIDPTVSIGYSNISVSSIESSYYRSYSSNSDEKNFAMVLGGANLTNSSRSDIFYGYDNTGDGRFAIARGIISVNTSSLPDNAIVNGLSMTTVLNSASQYGGAGILVPYTGPDIAANLTTWTSFGNTALATYNYNASSPGVLTQTISSAAYGYVNPTGYTRFGMRSPIDINGSMLSSWPNVHYVNFSKPPWNTWWSLNISYTVPPASPTVTYPNGGEIVDTSHNITWSAAPDADTPPSNLQYQIDLSTDNGASYSNIVYLTSPGVTSQTYNFSSIANTSQAYIRIRAFDGVSWGPWDYSNAPFIIQHNRLPNPPVITSYYDGQKLNDNTPTLSWNFSDPDVGDYQGWYQIVASNNGWASNMYDSGVIQSGNKSATLPAFPDGIYSFAIRTWDQSGQWTPPWGYRSNITIDRTPPSAPTINGSTTWSKSNVPVTITHGTDNLSGIARSEYSLSGATTKSWTTYSGEISIQNQGQTTITARTIDTAGNVSTTSTKIISIDKTAPTLAITNSDSIWHNTVLAVNITHEDSGGSNVTTRKYAVTNSEAKPTSGWSDLTTSDVNVILSTEGNNYVHVQIIDGAGNGTYQYKGPFKIDSSLPQAIEPSLIIERNAITITPNASDELSGLSPSPYLYERDGIKITDWVSGNSYTDSGLTPNKQYSYKYYVIDNAGNMNWSPLVVKYTRALDPIKVQITDFKDGTLSLNVVNNTENNTVPATKITAKIKGTSTVIDVSDWNKATKRTVSGISETEEYELFIQTRNEDGLENIEINLSTPSTTYLEIISSKFEVNSLSIGIPGPEDIINLDILDLTNYLNLMPFNLNSMQNKTVQMGGKLYYLTRNQKEYLENTPAMPIDADEFEVALEGFGYGDWLPMKADGTFSYELNFTDAGIYSTNIKFKKGMSESLPLNKVYLADWVIPTLSAKSKIDGQSAVTNSSYTIVLNGTDNVLNTTEDVPSYLFWTIDNVNWYPLPKRDQEITFTDILKSSTGTQNNLTVKVSDLCGNQVEETFTVWGIQQ